MTEEDVRKILLWILFLVIVGTCAISWINMFVRTE